MPLPPARRLAPALSLAVASAALSAQPALAQPSATQRSGTPTGRALSTTAPNPDPRVGLRAGLMNAAEAAWNLRVVSKTPPTGRFLGSTNSDIAFTGPYAIQGSYNGFQVWNIKDPSKPVLTTAYFCPASQSDVSVYRNLLFVSSESGTGRLDCGEQGVQDTVSKERLRGVRVFDISDIQHPRNVANVQTCRGSHTHTLVVDPRDSANAYVYISGSAGVRSPSELPGCVASSPEENANSALFRIEVVKVPVAHPEQAAIVSSPRIFGSLAQAPRHAEAPEDAAVAAQALAAAKARGAFTATVNGTERVVRPALTGPLLDSIVKARGGTGAATGADSAALRTALPGITAHLFGAPRLLTTQCHDITVYPAVGLAGGACEGYGLLLDIHDPAHPTRIAAVSDSNFSYWHSATFNNAGTKVLFTDEWGGGTQPKCRATDKKEWGADAIFTLANGKPQFQSYYKLPAAQTSNENCVAHNGSLIPIPGRDVMVQAWYQGGISVFDWTDPKSVREIAFFDRGPIDSTKLVTGGSWSAYWYNGVIVSSEIARGLDVFDLTPSAFLTQNEIDAAKTVHADYLNVQGQPKFAWPASFALARAYVDQLERSQGVGAARIAGTRQALTGAEQASGAGRRQALTRLATQLDGDARAARDAAKVQMLAGAVRELAAAR